MANEIRVGFIGAGSHAVRVHYPSLASFPDVEIAAACDLIDGRLLAVRERFGVENLFKDYREMLTRCDLMLSTS